MKKRLLSLILALVLMTALFAACGTNEEPGEQPKAPSSSAALPGGQQAAEPPDEAQTQAPPAEPVTLTIAGSWPDFRALDELSMRFTDKYPNCTVVYEYLQDYYASLEKRMNGEVPVDLFLTTNIQEGTPMLPYALDLYSSDELDLSETFPGLIQNFTFRTTQQGEPQIFAVPLGAEMRGLYVNKTLLDSLGIAVPTNQASLLAACKTLKDNGYIPFQGNPGNFSQLLIYPWACNLIANASNPEQVHAQVDSRQPGASELFREPMELMYLLVEEGYYDYKKAQNDLNLYKDTTDEAYAKDFLNIIEKDGQWVKADDVGQVAFMPSPMSLERVIEKTKEDYYSKIEYVFIPAPVSEDGGFVYLSPAHGIAVSKTSPNTEWAIKYINFLFESENNEAFAAAFNVIPNTAGAYTYIEELFDVPDNRISQVGEVTFSFGFYDVFHSHILDISKANNPKYMQDDGSGTLSLYPFEHFMSALESELSQG